MLKRLDSAYLDPRPSETSSRFYKAHGLVAIYRSVRRGTDGEHICLVGLSFPDGGTDVFVRDEPELHVTEMEIAAEDVPATFDHLTRRYPGVRWLREPFTTPAGQVAAVEIPGQTVLVLLGKVA